MVNAALSTTSGLPDFGKTDPATVMVSTATVGAGTATFDSMTRISIDSQCLPPLFVQSLADLGSPANCSVFTDKRIVRAATIEAGGLVRIDGLHSGDEFGGQLTYSICNRGALCGRNNVCTLPISGRVTSYRC